MVFTRKKKKSEKQREQERRGHKRILKVKKGFNGVKKAEAQLSAEEEATRGSQPVPWHTRTARELETLVISKGRVWGGQRTARSLDVCEWVLEPPRIPGIRPPWAAGQLPPLPHGRLAIQFPEKLTQRVQTWALQKQGQSRKPREG